MMTISRNLAGSATAIAILFASFGAPAASAASPAHRSTVPAVTGMESPVPVSDFRHGPRHDRGRHDRGGWDDRHGWQGGQLGPRQIRRSLRHRGFYDIRIIGQRGPVYMIRANGWRGRPVRLTVDAFDGRIVRIRPVWGRMY